MLLFCFFHSRSQEYRLVYDAQSLPELYTTIQVYPEVKQGGEFRRLSKNKYKLSAGGTLFGGNELRYNRRQLYDNNGIVDLKLHTAGKEIPLSLQLPVLEDIRINLYTDSIKPILNYYINVEGKFSSGRILPLDSSFVYITCDAGSMSGLEWIAPKERNFDRVHFTITNKYRPREQEQLVLYLKKYNDPRDSKDYQEKTEEEIINDGRKRRGSR